MAPSKPTSKKSNKAGGSSNTKKSSTLKSSKSRVSKSSSSSAPAIQQKSKRPISQTQADKRKKSGRRLYTEKELGIPALNTVTPVGVAKPRAGKRTGKVYVDDAASMMTIMAMVQAEKEGQIESKMLRARQLEEIRRLKQEEQEAREEERKGKLEDVKDSLRKKRRKATGSTGKTGGDGEGEGVKGRGMAVKKGKKRVSFG